MELQNTITKASQVFRRPDGSEVRITAQIMFGAGLAASTDVCVHHRESPAHPWRMCSNRPHPAWRQMLVDDYAKHGRSEALRVATAGEILRVVSLLGKPLCDTA